LEGKFTVSFIQHLMANDFPFNLSFDISDAVGPLALKLSAILSTAGFNFGLAINAFLTVSAAKK
jgi:hypothetical protein